MLWASCKDYADSTSMRVIYLSVLDLNGVLVWGGQITCIVDVSRVSDEKNVKITNVKLFFRITWCAYLKTL